MFAVLHNIPWKFHSFKSLTDAKTIPKNFMFPIIFHFTI